MIQVPIRTREGQDAGQAAVAAQSFGGKVRVKLLHEAVKMYAANKRVGTASTKERGDVAGSNKKPWRQKGTGRARAGNRRSPIWRGGGTVFGPHPRDYSWAMPKKQRQLAMRSAVLSKLKDGEVLLVTDLALPEWKTKQVAAVLKKLGVEGSCLIGTAEREPLLWRAARNIPGVKVQPVSDFNAFDVISARRVILTKAAFDKLQAEGTAEEAEEAAGAQP